MRSACAKRWLTASGVACCVSMFSKSHTQWFVTSDIPTQVDTNLTPQQVAIASYLQTTFVLYHILSARNNTFIVTPVVIPLSTCNPWIFIAFLEDSELRRLWLRYLKQERKYNRIQCSQNVMFSVLEFKIYVQTDLVLKHRNMSIQTAKINIISDYQGF